MTPRNFLVRGLLAGLAAGILSFGIAYTVGEPQVDAAIAVEDAHGAEPADGHHHEAAPEVSRDNQSTWGLATGTLPVAIALGGVAGLASAFAAGRLGRLRAAQSTAVVALVGYVAVGLVPFLKYPATPPAVGDPDTISSRTIEFFTMQGISVLAAIGAVLLARRLLAAHGTYRAVVAAGAVYLAIVILAAALLPTVNEIGDFPADTLWYFHRASLLITATMWGAIGVVLAGLIGRLADRESSEAARRALAASL